MSEFDFTLPLPQKITTEELAKITGIPKKFWVDRRENNDGPPYVVCTINYGNIGGITIKPKEIVSYILSDVQEWMKNNPIKLEEQNEKH